MRAQLNYAKVAPGVYHVPEQVYDQARSQFSAKELCDLTLAVATINAWNRLSISARLDPGGYQPATRPHAMSEA